MATTYNTPFIQKPDAGLRLADARSMFDAIVSNNANSSAYGITAVGTTQATAVQLTSVLCQVDTAASSTGVNLPSSTGTRAAPFQFCYVINNGANAITVYASQGGTDTINGVAGATGVSQASGVNAIYVSAKPGVWEVFGAISSASLGATSISGNLTFTTIGAGIVQKSGTNGKAGTFVLNGVTPVTVTNTSIAITDAIIISLNTVGGTVGVQPHVATITAATGFTVIGTASDTSTYNYSIISSAA